MYFRLKKKKQYNDKPDNKHADKHKSFILTDIQFDSLSKTSINVFLE